MDWVTLYHRCNNGLSWSYFFTCGNWLFAKISCKCLQEKQTRKIIFPKNTNLIALYGNFLCTKSLFRSSVKFFWNLNLGVIFESQFMKITAFIHVHACVCLFICEHWFEIYEENITLHPFRGTVPQTKIEHLLKNAIKILVGQAVLKLLIKTLFCTFWSITQKKKKKKKKNPLKF